MSRYPSLLCLRHTGREGMGASREISHVPFSRQVLSSPVPFPLTPLPSAALSATVLPGLYLQAMADFPDRQRGERPRRIFRSVPYHRFKIASQGSRNGDYR